MKAAERQGTAVSAVIINYNGRRFLPELLESLSQQEHTDFEVLLVDNASQDESVPFVESQSPDTRIVRLEKNLGFAAAGNIGVRETKGRYVVLLNTDLRLDSRWLSETVRAIEEQPSAAAIASKILLYDRPHLINGVGGVMNYLGYTWDRGMFEADKGQYDQPCEVLFAPAAAALFRRSAFIDSGGFDERFFMYHEDVDLGWRLWLLGHRILTAPSAVAYHHFGGSTKAARGLTWRELVGERNAMASLLKNYQAGNAVLALARMLLLKQSARRKWGQLRNFSWNLAHLSTTLSLRRSIQARRRCSDRELRRLIVQSRHVAVRL
jgi:GT2 family glycosyltransferase